MQDNKVSGMRRRGVGFGTAKSKGIEWVCIRSSWMKRDQPQSRQWIEKSRFTPVSLPQKIQPIWMRKLNGWCPTAWQKVIRSPKWSKKLAQASTTIVRAFLALLADQEIGTIVVEHRDRATRFGAHSIETLMQSQGRT